MAQPGRQACSRAAPGAARRAFHAQIDAWCDRLGHDIRARNPALRESGAGAGAPASISALVEELVAGLVFLRICEHRGVEAPDRMRATLIGAGAYRALLAELERAHRRYGAGFWRGAAGDPPLWEPATTLDVDDEVVGAIAAELYPPRSPYAPGEMGPELLGDVHERVLAGAGRPDAAPAVRADARKTDGVYYTPEPMVAFLLRETLGRTLDHRASRAAPVRVLDPACGDSQLAGLLGQQRAPPVRVLDPACGAGGFLAGAYRYLLDWHLARHRARMGAPDGLSGSLCRGPDGAWRLTVAERVRILRESVFGVDIDARAVVTTRRVLLLQALEGARDEPGWQPDRGLSGDDPGARNIICGNALIAPDVRHHPSWQARRSTGAEPIRPLDWGARFPDIVGPGGPGFDVVVGNPPYVDAERMAHRHPITRAYCAGRYQAARGNWDLFCVFAERALELLRPGGLHGFVVPNKIASADYARAARRLLAETNTLVLIRDYTRVPAFAAGIYPLAYVVRKERSPPASKPARAPVRWSRMGLDAAGAVVVERARELDYERCVGPELPTWRVFEAGVGAAARAASERLAGDADGDSELLRALDAHPTLAEIAHVHGAATVSEAYQLVELLAELDGEAAGALRVLNSGTIDPYLSLWGDKPMKYLRRRFGRPVVRAAAQARLPGRRLAQARAAKVIVAGMTRRLECVADRDGAFLAAKSTTVVLPRGDIDVRALAAVLNSAPMTRALRAQYGGLSLDGGYLRVGPPQLRRLRVPLGEAEQGGESGPHRALVELYDRIAALAEAERTASPRAPAGARERRQAAEAEVDRLVYRMLGLARVRPSE